MRFRFSQTALILMLLAPLTAPAAAEEFKYYVWIDDEGIVHAEEEPPKGVDYKVRIIEDVNANVVPAEDFRLYGDLPVDYGDNPDESEAAGEPAATSGGQAGKVITPETPPAE